MPNITSSFTAGSQELEYTQLKAAEAFGPLLPQSTLPTRGTTVLGLPAEEVI